MIIKPQKIYATHQTKQIFITGGIASGKTTLAHLLSQLEIPAILENFQSNPFWEAFYADPTGTAFETEITFLLQHYHQIKTASNLTKAYVCDFSPLLDLAYAKVTLDKGKFDTFSAVYREIQRELPRPDLVIHLACDPEIELERIRQRGRNVEQSITLDYLKAINQALQEVLRDEVKSIEILSIDSVTTNFAYNEADQQTVLDAVRNRVEQSLL